MERITKTVKLKDWRKVNRNLHTYLQEGKINEAKEVAAWMIQYLYQIGLIGDGILRKGNIYPNYNADWRKTYAASEKMI